MVVTPWKRLSDEVLSKAYQKFYRDEHLLPPGVPLESIQGWASRMAFGLRLCTQRFRKVYAESPVGAKSKEVAALKARLTKLGAYEAAPPGLQLSQEGMDTLFAPESLQRIRKYLNDKRTTQPAAGQGGDAAAAVEAKKDKDGAAAGPRRPVASVARSHRLPPLLLEALTKQPEAPKPFATDGTEGEADEAEDAESAGREAAAQSSKSKGATKPGPKKAVKPKAVKLKAVRVLDDREDTVQDHSEEGDALHGRAAAVERGLRAHVQMRSGRKRPRCEHAGLVCGAACAPYLDTLCRPTLRARPAIAEDGRSGSGHLDSWQAAGAQMPCGVWGWCSARARVAEARLDFFVVRRKAYERVNHPVIVEVFRFLRISAVPACTKRTYSIILYQRQSSANKSVERPTAGWSSRPGGSCIRVACFSPLDFGANVWRVLTPQMVTVRVFDLSEFHLRGALTSSACGV